MIHCIVTLLKEVKIHLEILQNKKNFKKLALKLVSLSFALNLATMYDCLEELSSLSVDLQERNTYNITQGPCFNLQSY